MLRRQTVRFPRKAGARSEAGGNIPYSGRMQSWPQPASPVVPAVVRHSGCTTQPIVSAAGHPGETATMYVCGITPYDATHLGHAATYLTFDIVNRVLRDQGHEVHYVQNVTDVDDPLFERADRDGIDWRDLGARETQLFRDDMTALRVLPPRDYIGAVESVNEVVEAVRKLVASGAAYILDDEYPDIYFRTDATEQFGYESGYDRATMDRFFAERGGDPDRPANVIRSTPCCGVPRGPANRRGNRRTGRAVPAGTSNARRSPSTVSASNSTSRVVGRT